MKTKFFLAAGLLCSLIGYGQATTTTVPPNVTDGLNNTFLGGAGGTSTTGAFNVFTGYRAGNSNVAGHRSVFVGQNAGYSNTSGGYNVAIGYHAGYRNQTGIYNTFVGAHAGDSTTLGYNTFVGTQAGHRATGGQSSYFGVYAGRYNPKNNNTFLGFSAGEKSTSGSSVLVGWQAGDNATGDYNVVLGVNAAQGTASVHLGAGNVIVGREAGQNNTGSNNVIVGHQAGQNNAGSSNVFLGVNAGKSETGSNRLYISNSTTNPLIYGEFDNKLLKVYGRVGIGYNGFGSFPNLTSSGTPNVSQYSLFVKGGILAEEVRIRLASAWPDYVFTDAYKLTSLKETERFIKENGHLPNMPSAKTVAAEGIEVGDMTRLQQEKIEELTLHLIQQSKEIEELKAQVQLLLNRK